MIHGTFVEAFKHKLGWPPLFVVSLICKHSRVLLHKKAFLHYELGLRSRPTLDSVLQRARSAHTWATKFRHTLSHHWCHLINSFMFLCFLCRSRWHHCLSTILSCSGWRELGIPFFSQCFGLWVKKLHTWKYRNISILKTIVSANNTALILVMRSIFFNF